MKTELGAARSQSSFSPEASENEAASTSKEEPPDPNGLRDPLDPLGHFRRLTLVVPEGPVGTSWFSPAAPLPARGGAVAVLL